eukprot:tig00020684_g12863.t1
MGVLLLPKFPLHYLLESLVANEMQGLRFEGCPLEVHARGACFRAGEDAVASFGYSYDNRYLNLLWLAVFLAAFELFKGLAIHRVVHLKR